MSFSPWLLEISSILSGLKLPVVSINKIDSRGLISLAQLTQTVKQSCDFPVPLPPKKSVTIPDLMPPPNKPSNDLDPVLIIIGISLRFLLNKSTACSFIQRKLFMVRPMSFKVSGKLVVFFNVTTSTQKATYYFTAGHK
jgi:hypothetical protein